MKKTINIRRDFSRYPGGRYILDGPFSGERFREEILIPALKDTSGKIYLELDGVRGYSSSFLEETFRGLIRKGFSAENILERLELIGQDQSLIDEIKEYISEPSRLNKF